MLFACIYIPDFPAEAIVRVEPELREQAVAIVEGKALLVHVIATNERARQLGIEIGTTQVQAQGYAASLQLRRRSLLQEQAAHAALMDCACAISPRVHGEAPDTVLLDIDGLERLFGPPAKIARELARRAGELGMEANVGVAANVEAAIHAARGFAGTTVIPRGREAERLAALPVEILFDMREERAQEMFDTLERWGVRTFRALALLPDVALAQRLGEAGVRLRKLARGEGSRPLVPAEAPLEFEEAVELEDAIEMLDSLMFVLNRMLDQLCTRLATRSLAAQELRLRMELDPQQDITIGEEKQNPPRRHGDTEKNSEFRIPNFDSEKPNHGFSRIQTDTTEETLRRGSARMDADRKSEIRNRKSEIENEDAAAKVENRNPKFEIHLKFPVPMRDTRVFLKLLQLELQARPPQAPVTRMWLRAEPARPRSTQGGLFVPEAPEPEKLEVTLARIASVVQKANFEFQISTFDSTKTNHGSSPIDTDAKTRTVGRGSTRMDAGEIREKPPRSHGGTEENKSGNGAGAGKREAGTEQHISHASTQPVDGLRVGVAEVLDSHRTDAFRMKRFAPGQRSASGIRHSRKHSAFSNQHSAKQNPPQRHRATEKNIAAADHQFIGSSVGVIALRRFRPALAARVRVENGRPVRLQATDAGGEEHAGEIVWASGPWRESGEWWHEPSWSRYVWDVAVIGETVTVYRIYSEREGWWVEGSYD